MLAMRMTSFLVIAWWEATSPNPDVATSTRPPRCTSARAPGGPPGIATSCRSSLATALKRPLGLGAAVEVVPHEAMMPADSRRAAVTGPILA
jgi:hypothetical protein